jgi:hypothetical protein
MAINTVPNVVIQNSTRIISFFGREVPKGVTHIDVINNFVDDSKLACWTTKTGNHTMPIDLDNLDDSLTAVIVTMRMTC